MSNNAKNQYLFVAIDRATRWVYPEIFAEKTALAAHRFPHRLREARPSYVCTILTDYGKEFTIRIFGASVKQPSFRQPNESGANDQTLDLSVESTGNVRGAGAHRADRCSGKLAWGTS